MSGRSALRLLGVTVRDVSDWRQPSPQGKSSQLFAALAEQFSLVDVVRAQPSREQELVNLARSAHPSKRVWLARADFNQRVLRQRSASVQRGLERHRGAFDLIFQLQTMCGPGLPGSGEPYVIYTDCTLALIRRHFAPYAPISPTMARDWMRFESDVCRGARTVFTYSQFARASMIEDYGCSPEQVHVVGAGSNHLRADFAPVDRPSPVALFVGRDFIFKGGDVLLRAWGAVHRELPQARLIIAGPKRGRREFDSPGVEWVGRIGWQELNALYRSSSLFVLPTRFDAWGLSFLEAMGSGLPCVGTACCAMPEMIDDGVNGRLVAPGEAEPLAEALLELLGDPARLAEMGRAAYDRVLRDFRWPVVAQRMRERLSLPEVPAG